MKFKRIPYSKHEGNKVKFAPNSEIIKLDNKAETTYQFTYFESLAGIVRCVDENMKTNLFSNFIDRSDNSWRYGSYFKTREITAEMLTTGSIPDSLMSVYIQAKEDLLRDHPELLDLTTKSRKFKRKRTFKEDGGELNIDRYMTGEVEMWERSFKVNKKPIIKILISGAVSSQVSPQQMLKNITASVAVIDILSNAGISCELWYSVMVRGAASRLTYSAVYAKVKDGNQPCDISRILSCAAPGLLRDFIFSLYDNIFYAYTGEAKQKSYGYPAEKKEVEQANIINPFDLTVYAGGQVAENIKYLIEGTEQILSQSK